ncbi:MAG: hypothetical protein AB7O66_07250 [Limisphaerales bacterium]
MKTRIILTSILAAISLWGFNTLAQPASAESGDSGRPAPQGPGGPRMAFSTLDRNGDGSVSEAEFNQARSEMRGRMNQGGGPGFLRGPGPSGADDVRPRGERTPRSESASAAPDPDAGERRAADVERPGRGPRRERALAGDGAGAGIQRRERRQDGVAVGQGQGQGQGRGRGQGQGRAEFQRQGRPGGPEARADRPGMQAFRGPRPELGRGDRQGPGGMRRPERRDGVAGVAPMGPRGFRGPGMGQGGNDGGRRPARDGMGPHGARRLGPNAGGVCPDCGCPLGRAQVGGGGRGPRGAGRRG